MSGYISGAAETEGPPSTVTLPAACGAALHVADLLGLDVHAGDQHDVGPGEIGVGRGADVLVDEADLPAFRHVGGDQQQPLRRHERPHPVHQLVGVLERAEGRRIGRKHAQNATFILNGHWAAHSPAPVSGMPNDSYNASWRFNSLAVMRSGRGSAADAEPDRPAKTSDCSRACKSLYAAQHRSAQPSLRTCISEKHNGPPQRRDHRPRRPWQDHAGRPPAAAVGRLPRQPAPGRARDGFQRPGARARHHHPRQGDLDPVAGTPHQHRRYAGPRRFRRRGRAHPQHGRRRAGAGRCRRRPAAADQVRGVEGAEAWA